MGIELNSKTWSETKLWRTLDQPIYLKDGKRVMEVWENGTKVYPEELKGYECIAKIVGSIDVIYAHDDTGVTDSLSNNGWYYIITGTRRYEGDDKSPLKITASFSTCVWAEHGEAVVSYFDGVPEIGSSGYTNSHIGSYKMNPDPEFHDPIYGDTGVSHFPVISLPYPRATTSHPVGIRFRESDDAPYGYDLKCRYETALKINCNNSLRVCRYTDYMHANSPYSNSYSLVNVSGSVSSIPEIEGKFLMSLPNDTYGSSSFVFYKKLDYPEAYIDGVWVNSAKSYKETDSIFDSNRYRYYRGLRIDLKGVPLTATTRSIAADSSYKPLPGSSWSSSSDTFYMAYVYGFVTIPITGVLYAGNSSTKAPPEMRHPSVNDLP